MPSDLPLRGFANGSGIGVGDGLRTGEGEGEWAVRGEGVFSIGWISGETAPSVMYSFTDGSEMDKDGLGCLMDDFRLARSTSRPWSSLLTLTTRCDIFFTIVPARCRGVLGEEDDNDLFRELDLLGLLPPGECRPASAFARSSPNMPPGIRSAIGEKRTLLFLLPCLCPVGVRGSASFAGCK